MSVLHNRIKFTQMVEEVINVNGNNNDLSSVQRVVADTRAKLMLSLGQPQIQHDHEPQPAQKRQLRNLCTLYQEFHDVLRDLNKAEEKKQKDIWANEMRFYEASNGAVLCRCNGIEVTCSDDYRTSDMLVVTQLTRQIRPKLLDAMINKKIYLARGPAGTGKTETVKDTMRMLGMETVVISCSDAMPPVETLVDMWKEQGPKSGDKNCAVCFDEFNRCQLDVQEAILDSFMKEGIFICVTCNPGYAGRIECKWADRLPTVQQEFTIPPYEDIVRCMLATEGVLECDELGPKFVTFFNACREQMTKNDHYDFGMRAIKSTCRAFGAIYRAVMNQQQKKNVSLDAANALARICWAPLVKADRLTLLQCLKTSLGLEEDVAAPAEQSITEQLVDALRIRHGVAVIGVNPSSAEVEKIQKELNEQCNAKSVTVSLSGTKAEGFGEETTTGASWFWGGSVGEKSWSDGTVTKAMREAAREPQQQQRFHIYFSGDFTVPEYEWFENLHETLDDNKVLRLPTGEKIPLKPNTRLIFFLKDAKTMSPASVSRLGCVAAE